MTDALRRAGLLTAAFPLLLAGCSDDDSAPLAEDDLPGEVVESTSNTAGAPTATRCEDVTDVQQDISVSGASEIEDNYRYWTYRLDDGTWIAVSVIQTGYPYEDQDQALADLAEAVDSCIAEGGDDPVTALDGAPEGSVGYASTMTDSNGTTEGETLVATAGDRVVTVVATHDEGAEPSVDVRDLLDDVLDRAGDLDLS